MCQGTDAADEVESKDFDIDSAGSKGGVPAPSLTYCVTLLTSLNPSKPVFSDVKQLGQENVA